MGRIVPGKYTAIAKEWKLGESDEKHTPFIGIQFELLDEHVNGITMNWSGWLTDAAIDRTLESLRACGWRGKDLSDLTGIGDRRVTVVINDEVSQKDGKTYARISFVNKLGGGRLTVNTELAPDRMRQLVAISKAKAAELPVLAPDLGAPPVAKGEREPGSDDDIGF